ncbi:MAG: hypothetical protein KDD84_14820 [Caldilineaceae bacterium]|nr:hypothetical protein [Caldilineaceae bacterium]
MSDHENAHTHAPRPMIYQIRLQGHLDPRWVARLAGLTISLQDNGDTLITGHVADQAALHGLLRTVRDLGIPLLSVNRLHPDQWDQDTPTT